MKQIKLRLYNNGEIRDIAMFLTNEHESIECMKSLNDALLYSHNKLEDVFYFISYQRKKNRSGVVHIYVDHNSKSETGLSPNHPKYVKKIQAAVIKSLV